MATSCSTGTLTMAHLRSRSRRYGSSITRHSMRIPIKRVHIASEASLVVLPSARKKSIPSSIFKRVTPTNVVMKRIRITDHVIPSTAGSSKRREPTSIAIARHHRGGRLRRGGDIETMIGRHTYDRMAIGHTRHTDRRAIGSTCRLMQHSQ